jgi:actin related protein 2/3 complex subunit 4
MANSLASYLAAVKETLNSVLNLRNFPSEAVEKHNKPYVETGESSDLKLNNITITRTEFDRCLIEPSINSVRISFAINQSLEIEKCIIHMFHKFLALRADKLELFRKKPLPGYDFTFLITNEHLETMHKEYIINFILLFMQDIEKEISDMKIELISQLRVSTFHFINSIAK